MLRERQIGLRFRRQHPIGPYILDFYCPSMRLCVEVDGPVHEGPEQIARDRRRDAWLLDQRITVLRVSSEDVEESPAAVLEKIRTAAASVIG